MSSKRYLKDLKICNNLFIDMATVSIYEKFPKENIHVNDDYTSAIHPILLSDTLIRIGNVCENGLVTGLAVNDGKAQSITNKQLFYQPNIIGGEVPVDYVVELYSTYNAILQTPKEEYETIETPVLYAIDYDCAQGTGHSYDFFFYLMYCYKELKLSCPLVVPKTEQYYINLLYDLLEKYYNIRLIRLESNKTYFCHQVICMRAYVNVFFPSVKNFINETMITPILEKFKDRPTYPIVAKLKVSPKHSVYTQGTIFQPTELFSRFCKENNVLLLDETFSEEEKIYYLNKANTILVTWGSIYYINIDYYLRDTNNKFISILFHKRIMPERRFITQHPFTRTIHQSTANSIQDNIYNTMTLNGEIIDNMESLDEFVEKTILKKL